MDKGFYGLNIMNIFEYIIWIYWIYYIYYEYLCPGKWGKWDSGTCNGFAIAMETEYILATNFLEFKQMGPLFLHGKFKVNQVYSSKNIFD